MEQSSWRWLIDWQEASKHPIRTLAFMFVAGFVCAGLATYYIGSSRSLSTSVAVGVVCGVVLLVVGLRGIRDPGGVVARATKASRRMLVCCAVGAFGLALASALLSDWQLAAAALPPAVLAAALFVVRRSL
jgi:hypothetical protein